MTDEQIDTVLGQWQPDSDAVDPYTARAQTRRAVEWLRERDGTHGREAFVNALADGSTLDTVVWWTGVVQPGLDRFHAVGLADRPPDGTYRWVGDAAGERERTEKTIGDTIDEWREKYDDLTPIDEQDTEELREFLECADSGKFDSSRELNQTVRIIRSLLDARSATQEE